MEYHINSTTDATFLTTSMNENEVRIVAMEYAKKQENPNVQTILGNYIQAKAIINNAINEAKKNNGEFDDLDSGVLDSMYSDTTFLTAAMDENEVRIVAMEYAKKQENPNGQTILGNYIQAKAIISSEIDQAKMNMGEFNIIDSGTTKTL